MTVIFAAHQIACRDRHAAPVLGSPTAHVRRAKFFGEVGEAEVTGGRTGRPISVECWIHDKTWTGKAGSDKLEKYFEQSLYSRIGTQGALQFTGLYQHSFLDCTLDSVERVEQFPPRIDDVGLLGFEFVKKNGDLVPTPRRGIWYTVAILNFYQLWV